MKQTEIIMGMPITVEIVDSKAEKLIADTFDYFRQVDNRFSTYKEDSEISQINNGLGASEWSEEMKLVLMLSEQTKQTTNGYFDINHNGKLDPSGLVKGWSIWEAAKQLKENGITNFYIEAGGDIQTSGHNQQNEPWTVGIRNPFNREEIIKVLRFSNKGVATSGTYIRGQHIYNPHQPNIKISSIQSLTVVADNIYEADRFATAAFAMEKSGIGFIEEQPGLEGYVVDSNGVATMTSGFKEYVNA